MTREEILRELKGCCYYTDDVAISYTDTALSDLLAFYNAALYHVTNTPDRIDDVVLTEDYCCDEGDVNCELTFELSDMHYSDLIKVKVFDDGRWEVSCRAYGAPYSSVETALPGGGVVVRYPYNDVSHQKLLDAAVLLIDGLEDYFHPIDP